MWFLFILPISLLSSLATLASATSGMTFVILSVASLEWQRRQGYRGTEGRLSERENEAYYGVGIDPSSTHDITNFLGALADAFPSLFEAYVDKKYDLTINEGALLRAILSPAMKAYEEYAELAQTIQGSPNDDVSYHLLEVATERMASSVVPIIEYLRQFPEKRIKKVRINA